MADETNGLRRHFIFRGIGDSRPYKGKGGGGKGKPLPARDRRAHGTRLIAALEAVESKQQEIERIREEQGFSATGDLVSFEFQLHKKLKPKNFEDRRVGTQLLTYREVSDEMGVATVYVPEGELAAFETKIREYIDEDTDTGKPRNQVFVASIETVRRARLEELWTDPIEVNPPTGDEKVWWEVWIRDEVFEDDFRREASKVGWRVSARNSVFPGRKVFVVLATPGQMLDSVDLLDSLAEVRRARSIVQDYFEFDAVEQMEWVNDLVKRTVSPGSNSPAVCILDSGVDHRHPLLTQAVDKTDVDAVDQEWGKHDHHGHGTEMAGVALYGERLDETLASRGTLKLKHRLESVKIVPSRGANDPELYGEITKSAVAIAELNAPERKRAISMAMGGQDVRDGTPTSWSAAIDQICAGAEEGDDDERPRRLFFVSGGNADWREQGYVFPAANFTERMNDPAQAWNAITVGAFTTRTQIEPPGKFPDWRPLASSEDMSPSNTTSITWDHSWPAKPDVVMEGGNIAEQPDKKFRSELESLWLLTSKRRQGVQAELLTITGETSAATNLAARMGALIWEEYPDLWPETVRALIIHSARWTQQMESYFPQVTDKARMAKLLRCFGYGVPSLERALGAVSNEVSLVVEDYLQPFHKSSTRYRNHEIKLHRLPWPDEALEQLGDATVRLRVTLSYFVEPNPAQRGWTTRYKYPSHGLRFYLPKASESEEHFIQRVNPGERPSKDKSKDSSRSTEWQSDSEEWRFWDGANRGSIHSDVWEGTAADLLNRGLIAVTPVIGWWREYTSQNKYNRRTRYSLIASIETESTEVDLHSEVAQKVEPLIKPEIEI